VRWFLPLYVLGGLKALSPRHAAHRREVSHRDAWLDLAHTTRQPITILPVAILERAGW